MPQIRQTLSKPNLLVQSVFPDTSLGGVYQGLAQGKLQQQVAEFLADQTSEPNNWPFPEIRHADGYEAYQVRSCSQLLLGLNILVLCAGSHWLSWTAVNQPLS